MNEKFCTFCKFSLPNHFSHTGEQNVGTAGTGGQGCRKKFAARYRDTQLPSDFLGYFPYKLSFMISFFNIFYYSAIDLRIFRYISSKYWDGFRDGQELGIVRIFRPPIRFIQIQDEFQWP